MLTHKLQGLLALSALSAPFAGALALQGAAHEDEGRGFVAIKAGAIHVVEDGRVVENGTILVRDGTIQAVGGPELAIPIDAEVVDYGPSAVVIPGLVAADSGFAIGSPHARTAEPSVRAIDNFDFYAQNASALAAGVTSAYLSPTESRLIGGEGAVVKLAGDDPDRRVLRSPATIHASVAAAARNTPGFWEPPVPATADVGIGFAKDQLPKTVMGAIVALDELLDAAQKKRPTDEYGEHAVAALAALLENGAPWRVTAQTEEEIRAVLAWARARDVRLVIEGATEAGFVAEEIAAAGVPVVYSLPWSPNRSGIDRGKDEDARWPSYDVPAKLVAAGVPVAIAASSSSDLFFAAAVASQGDLDPQAALRALTLTPAEIYGVADRVGSIRPGKDADLVVLGGPPIALGASVLATWVDGERAWTRETSGARAVLVEEGGRFVEDVAIQVDQLFVGDGRVLSPGQIVIRDGRIASVSEGHSAVPGARVVRGPAAMPGMVDALGHLGLEGSSRAAGLDFAMSSIVAPGDAADRRVAKAGVTTVGLAPRGVANGGSPVLAYKPAAEVPDALVVEDPAAVRLSWTDAQNRLNSGKDVRELLQKVKDYRDKWREYEAAIAKWTPPPAQPKAEDAEAEKGDAKPDATAEEKPAEGSDDAQQDGDDKKKKKKKDEPEEIEPDPITGVWSAQVERPPLAEPAPLSMRLKLELEEPERKDGAITGNLRCPAVSDGLVDVEGWYDGEAHSVSLKGLGTQGFVALEAVYGEQKLKGTLKVGADAIEVEIARTSRDFVVAKRTEVRRAKPQEDPKGKPKEPRRDPGLEPLKKAMDGETAVIVTVDRDDEILACVETFAQYGIKPVLYGAAGIGAVASQVTDRIDGVLLSHQIRAGGAGTDVSSPYVAVQEAGIKVAFHSEAEEGAADLVIMAMYAVANGMSPVAALRALTSDAAAILAIDERVGVLEAGKDGDVLLLSGPPLAPGTRVLRVWVNGDEVE